MMKHLLTEKELRCWLAFLRTSVRVNCQLADDMQHENKVPISWYDVLVHLYHGPEEGQSMQTLAGQMVMSNSGLTRLLDRMVEKGLVARKPSTEDRRVVLAKLTEQGRELLETLLPQHQARVHDYLIQHLTPEEMEVMTAALERVSAALKEEQG